MRAVVGAARPDVERDVADQPDAARGRVAPQRRSTRARSAPGRRRRPRRRSAPSRRSSTRARRGTPRAPASLTGAPGSASRAGQAAKADVDVYGEPERSGGPSGSTCHQDWPAAASQSTNAYAAGPSAPPGRDVTWSRIPLERGRFTMPMPSLSPLRTLPAGSPGAVRGMTLAARSSASSPASTPTRTRARGPPGRTRHGRARLPPGRGLGAPAAAARRARRAGAEASGGHVRGVAAAAAHAAPPTAWSGLPRRRRPSCCAMRTRSPRHSASSICTSSPRVGTTALGRARRARAR